MKLHEVMRLDEPCRVAVVGAGGKTSTLWRLAEGLSGKVVITTTTHLGLDQIDKAEQQIFIEPEDDLTKVDWMNSSRIVSITGPAIDGHRLSGLTQVQIDRSSQISKDYNFSILIEADGAQMLPLKAPGEHEPVIPGWVDAAIVLAGMPALGKPLDDKSVFRVKDFSTLSGIPEGEPITAEGIQKVLCNPDGGLKGIPEKARRILALNQAEDHEDQPEIMRIANYCKDVYDQVLITSLDLAQPEPLIYARVESVAAIILAAGGATRMNGLPKPLLQFQDESLVRRAVRTAIRAGLAPVIVVTGYRSDVVVKSLDGLDIEVIENLDWENGQSSSIRAGIQQLGSRSGAAIFMLVDQPFTSWELLEALMEEHRKTLSPIIAPLVDDQRSNPVIFDRVTFEELSTIKGDTGGRAIMGHFEHSWLPWLDQRILMDIDTPEDLERCINAA